MTTVVRLDLFYYAKHGYLAEVQNRLLDGANVTAAKDNGCTPLFIAAQNGHKEIVQLLLAVPGININAAKDNGCTPLYIAAEKGHKEIVQLLLALS